MRVFEVLPVQPGERVIGPAADEIRSVIARIDQLIEQVRGSGGGLTLFHALEREVNELEERTRLYLGLPPDPEGEYPYGFRRVEDGILVLVWLGEF